MSALNTTYLGLQLDNPFIASSSGLTGSPDKIKALDEAGVGAIVLKSLFEEQILGEAHCLAAREEYPEAADYIRGYVQGHALDKYLTLISEAKASCRAPIIASIHCATAGQWVEYAKHVQEAGADALEVNIFILPTDPNQPAAHYEKQYLTVAEALTKQVKIPVAVKLSRNFTNPLHIMQQLRHVGVQGAVLFNRLYEPDINVRTLKVGSANVFSIPEELSPTLRWLAFASARIDNLDLAASTGIHTAQDAAKAILAGANATQLCTILYRHKPEHVKTLIEELKNVLETANIASVEELRGRLNYANHPDPILFERSQFMRYFASRK